METSRNFRRKTRGYVQGICDTNPAISLKRSSLEPELLQSVYRNSCTLSNGDKSGDLRWTLVCFSGEQNFFIIHVLHTFVGAWRIKLAVLYIWVWPIETCSPNFMNFGSGSHDIMRQRASILIKWFFDNFSMFADSSTVLSSHCVARGLGALYKFLASHGSSLWQHGFLVAQHTAECLYTLQWAVLSHWKLIIPTGDVDPI